MNTFFFFFAIFYLPNIVKDTPNLSLISKCKETFSLRILQKWLNFFHILLLVKSCQKVMTSCVMRDTLGLLSGNAHLTQPRPQRKCFNRHTFLLLLLIFQMFTEDAEGCIGENLPFVSVRNSFVLTGPRGNSEMKKRSHGKWTLLSGKTNLIFHLLEILPLQLCKQS